VQSTAPGTTQLPVPLQAPAGWKVVALVQLKLVHMMPAPVWAQTPPEQNPVLPQGGLEPHRPCGSIFPSGTAAHIPGVEPLQTQQVAQEVELQQTPSTQLPVVHSWPEPQLFPGVFFGWQEPFAPVQK
jgi:hypothetical protein